MAGVTRLASFVPLFPARLRRSGELAVAGIVDDRLRLLAVPALGSFNPVVTILATASDVSARVHRKIRCDVGLHGAVQLAHRRLGYALNGRADGRADLRADDVILVQ